MMQTMLIAATLTFLTGCVGSGVNESALKIGLNGPIKEHIKALAGEDINLMRRTGLVVVEKFYAGTNQVK